MWLNIPIKSYAYVVLKHFVSSLKWKWERLVSGMAYRHPTRPNLSWCAGGFLDSAIRYVPYVRLSVTFSAGLSIMRLDQSIRLLAGWLPELWP
eukprot:COSAG01_NODE_20433_length_953_cov_2.606557_1_plen_92_part_01